MDAISGTKGWNQAKVEAFAADGWEIAPGTVPIAVYHVMRQKNRPPQPAGGIGTLRIDESKIFIRASDGTLR